MGAKVDFVRKKYGPLARKTLSSALLSCLAKDFPQLGGERMLRLSAERILEVVFQHIHTREAVQHGQVLWMGIAVDERPGWHKPLSRMQLVPLVLDWLTAEDVEAMVRRESRPQRLLRRCLRLCRQAHQQGGLLSNCDLAMMLGVNDSWIAHLLADYERHHDSVVPRRATLHDVGTGLTHKRWICWKRYGEGKTSEQVARETYHSIEAVDRYLGQFDRVRHCRRQGFSEAQTAYVLGCSEALVREYSSIDEELLGHKLEENDEA
ncbi:MAG: DUF1670 domain-containing protein [Planctomycetales bacterium]|nr:DUF1670 domain-containing protein [Planctomycetales bacterium]